MKYLVGGFVAIMGVIVAVLVVAKSGVIGVGADHEHHPIVYRFLQEARMRSIERASQDIPVPNLSGSDLIASGGADYEDMCADCHLSPTVTMTDLSQGLYPRPPNFTDAQVTSHYDSEAGARQAFWAIKHGIMASGMPAWGATHDDERLWAMIAFIRTLPTLDADQYTMLTTRFDMDMLGDMAGMEDMANARSPDYSNGVDYGQYMPPMMMGRLPMWGVKVAELGYVFDEALINYNAHAWYGTDRQRLYLTAQGDVEKDDEGGYQTTGMTSLAYWQPTSIFWNVLVGAAYDSKLDEPALMIGMEGTAPYFIETSAKAYAYQGGQVQAELGAEYEWRLNQRLVFIPEASVTLYTKDDHQHGIVSGFNKVHASGKLTYEMLNRQFAPYVGISYESALGKARDHHRNHNESVDTSSAIAGVSFWF